jgi:hypothetical protein
VVNATAFGTACLQQPQNNTVGIPMNLPPSVLSVIEQVETALAPVADSEDCTIAKAMLMETTASDCISIGLFINVFSPTNATSISNLPVLFVSRYAGVVMGQYLPQTACANCSGFMVVRVLPTDLL